MRTPFFVRPLTADEQAHLTAALRSSDAFTLRRAQSILASARGERAPRIARALGCDDQTVRDAITAFTTTGLAALRRGSSVPHTLPHKVVLPASVERLRALLHHSPRTFGYETSLWTLELAAEEAARQGITPRRVTGETIRAVLAHAGVRWLRAKRWITSPDPEYARKKASATG
jgi:transposase